jgi:hypothetical protein
MNIKIFPLQFKASKEPYSDEWESRPSNWLVFRIREMYKDLFILDMFCGKWTRICECDSYEAAEKTAHDTYLDMIKQLGRVL